MEIQLYDTNGNLQKRITKVLDASLLDQLDGTSTFSFSCLTASGEKAECGMLVKLKEQYYSITQIKRRMQGVFSVVDVTCEHITNQLNEKKYNLTTFVFEGTPQQGLEELLRGTPFEAGIVEPEALVEIAFTEGELNRRNALIRYAEAVGGEIEYDGYKINLRKHRGSTTRKELMDGKNVTSLSATYDVEGSIQAYEINLYQLVELSVGDEISITYRPFGITASTRIVSIKYNPFYRYTVKLEVGDYVPRMIAASTERMEELKQSFHAANGELRSVIERVDGTVSGLSQTIDSFEMRIENAASSVSSFSQTIEKFEQRITSTEGEMSTLSQTVGGFDLRIENAENLAASVSLTVNGFDSRITNEEGTVSSFSQTILSMQTQIESSEGTLSSLVLKADGLETRMEDAESNISSVVQTASGLTTRVAAVEKSHDTLSDSVSEVSQTASALVTRVSDAENSISTITQTATSLSTKVSTVQNNLTAVKSSVSEVQQTATSLTTRITTAEGNISTVTATASKISWLIQSGTSSTNFTLTDRAVSLVAGTIDLSGYVTISNLKTSGKTVIDGGNITTGTIDAQKVSVKNLQINNVAYGTYPVITCTGSNRNPILTVGKDQLSNSVAPNKLMLYGTYIQIGDETSSLYSMKLMSGTISVQGSTLNIGGSSYYLVFNSSREFRPNQSSSSYAFSLGTSSYPWHYGYITHLYIGTTVRLGSSTSAKVGFFGTTPIARKSVSTVSTSGTTSAIATGLNNLIAALKSYGLITS